MNKYILIITILSISFSSAQDFLTLEDAIAKAIENSHEIAIIKNDKQLVKNNTHIGAAGILPNIIISSGYNGSINNSNINLNGFLDLGDNTSNIEANKAQSSNLTSSINLNYRLFNGFSGIYTLKKFSKQNQIAKENLRAQIEDKILEIITLYYDLLNKDNIYNVLSEAYNVSLDRYNRTQERYEYGSISKLEVLNAEVDLNTDLISFKNSENNVQSARLNLSLAMGVSNQKETYHLVNNFSFNTSLNLDTLKQLTTKNNASIIISELNHMIAEHNLKLSKSSFAPSIDLFTSYSYNNMKSETSFISEQKDHGFVGGISIELPIFTSNIKRKQFQNAKINLDSQKHQLALIKETIETSLINTFFSYQHSLDKIELQKNNLDTYEINFTKSKELYQMGQLNSIQFRESQNNLSRFRINYSSTLFSAKIQEYIIYQLSGQLQNTN
jgi:outer membrane protein